MPTQPLGRTGHPLLTLPPHATLPPTTFIPNPHPALVLWHQVLSPSPLARHHPQCAGSKKLAPVPPKVPYGQSGGMSDQSTGQPSPVSLSPTPPSTPSPYGLTCPPGQLPPSSPGQTPLGPTHSLSSPPSLSGTLTKSRPALKLRQRPSLPPPQPPPAPPPMVPVPQPLEQGLLDGLSPEETMSTGKHQPLETSPPPPPQVGLQRPSLRLAVALSNGDGGRV
ncbi:hypothetical protein GOODEAATRI_005136 [Goodea atripinnis]|uniref:Rho GTPase activating protein 33 n=1 Tax=Goodea atripinnis TaxID=208336 RepID=A0ABV0MF74_9TELE